MLKPLGFQQLTFASNVATLLTVPAGTRYCLVTVEGAAARFRDDGTAPTAAVGSLLNLSNSPFMYTGNPNAIQFIGTTTSTIVNVEFYND